MKPPASMNGAPATADAPLPQASFRPPGSRQFKPKPGFSPVGIAVMVAAHGLLGYALVSGMAGKAIQTLKKPLDATIIAEVTLPPPLPPSPPPSPSPPLPPKIKKIERAPKVAMPPPAYVPPPDIARAAATAPAITAVQTTQAVAPQLAAPPSPPPAPTPVVAAPAKADMALVCQKQIKPEAPRRAIEDGVEGTVKAEVRVRGGKVVDVRIVSGPRAYHAAVRTALGRYECDSSTDQEFIVTQDFTFKLE